MIDDPQKDETLEALFKAARDNPADLRAEFVARLIADADNAALAPEAIPSPQKNSRWARFANNWLPASGLTAATVLGVWIGTMLPDTRFADAWLTNDATDVDLTAFLPGSDLSQFADLEADG